MPTVSERRASLEIISKMPILFIGRLPILSKKTKNGILVNSTKKFSKKAFALSALRIINMIEFSKNESGKYKDSWEETYAMIRGNFAMFYDYKNEIHARVKEHRKKYNLPI